MVTRKLRLIQQALGTVRSQNGRVGIVKRFFAPQPGYYLDKPEEEVGDLPEIILTFSTNPI